MKLLLIEDSLSIQTLVEAAFAQADVDIIVTDNALDGLHKAQTIAPDMVLADAALPDLDGFQICQRIRHTASGRHVPVVLLTSSFATYDAAKGDLAGVTAHLGKPFAPHRLIELVQQYLPRVHDTTPLPSPAATTLAFPSLAQDPDPVLHTETSREPPEPVSPEPGHAFSGIAIEAMASEAGFWSGFSQTVPQATELPLPTVTVSDLMDGISAEAPAPVPLDMPQAELGHDASDAGGPQMFYHTLGRRLEQILREALVAQLPQALADLRPHILATVRAVVVEQMPDMLAALLQQEIERLKRAAAQGSDEV